MIEVYLFYAMFTAQVVVFSVLYPTTMIRNVHAALTRYPVERSPLEDERSKRWLDRWLTLYRHVNTGVALVGLLLLALLWSFMQRPRWDEGEVAFLLTIYFLLQMVPAALFWWQLAKGNKQLKELLRGEKRAGMAFGVHRTVYGRKSSPLLTQEDHHWEIEVTVKILVYTCTIAMLALSVILILSKLDMPSVEPLAQSTFFVVIGALLCGIGRQPSQQGVAKAA